MTHRVLFMISSMRGGGSERQTLMLLKHLDRSLFTPHLYVMERTGDLMAQIPKDVSIHSFEDVRQEPMVYLPGGVMRQQVRHLAKLLRDESIDVIYDRTFHMTMIAGPASQRRKVPRVSTIVSPPELALPLVEKRFVRMKQQRLAKAYYQSHQVLAVSQIAADSAKNFYGLPSDAVDVVPNPVDCGALQQTGAGPPKKNSDAMLTLVCVGRMTHEKGHHDLISAVSLAQTNWSESQPPMHIRFVGDGPLRHELEVHAKNIQPPHSVAFLGSLSDVVPSITGADALVLPSHFEGMPNVVLEAMALKIPVIATRAGGTVELEREEPTILWAEPGNAESLAAAIRSFAADPVSALARVRSATQLISERHDVAKTSRIIERYLLDACR